MVLKLNASQKRGALVFLAILGVVAIWRMRVFFGDETLAPADSIQHHENQSVTAMVRVELNTADSASLDSVSGIGPTFARRIVRYRQLIGGYTNPEQLMNVFGITPEAYLRMEPYVYVDTLSKDFHALKASRKSYKRQYDKSGWRDEPRKEWSKRTVQKEFEQSPSGNPVQVASQSAAAASSQPSSAPSSALVNLNTADSTTLVKLPGIGPGTAGRIIKYRNRISFFKSLDQLAEVWGMRPENLEKMKPHLTVGDLDAFPRVNINQWDVEHLGKHPYIGFKDARIIVAYREEHGPYKRAEDLRWVLGIDPLLPGRLDGYLTF